MQIFGSSELSFISVNGGQQFGVVIGIAFVGSTFGIVLRSSPCDYVPWLAGGRAILRHDLLSMSGAAVALNCNKCLMPMLSMPQEAFVVTVIVNDFLLLFQKFSLIFAILMGFLVPRTPALLLFVPGW